MNNFFKVIAKTLVLPLIFTLHLAGYNVQPNTPPVVQSSNLGAFNPTGGGTYYLSSSIGLSNTTISLSSFTEPISGIPYTMTYLNSSIGYGTLDPQQPTRSEFISFTGITQNSNGSATLTGVSRGLSRSYPYTASSTLVQAHSGQSIFILSDSPQLFSEYAVKRNDETITGSWSFPAPTSPNNPATKSYVDGTAFGGIGGATETATGTVQIATGLQIASSTTNGSIGRLVIPASLATSTFNAATAGLKAVVTQNNGTIDPNFIPSTFTKPTTFAATTTLATTTSNGIDILNVGKNIRVFTASGTWLPPTGIATVTVQVIGPGGQGGGSSTAGGGGAGGYALKAYFLNGTTSVNIVVSTSAGTSTFGGVVFASSGLSTASAAGGLGGIATGGDINLQGGGGTGGNATTAGAGGNSVYGFGGNAVLGAGTGGTGTGFGGGGAGGTNAGPGAPGAVIITW